MQQFLLPSSSNLNFLIIINKVKTFNVKFLKQNLKKAGASQIINIPVSLLTQNNSQQPISFITANGQIFQLPNFCKSHFF